MDEIQDWEISLLADNVNYGLKDEWNMTRWIVYSVLQPYLKKTDKQKSMTQLFPLPSDTEYEVEHDIEISNEQIETLKEHAKMFAQNFFNKKDNNGSRNS